MYFCRAGTSVDANFSYHPVSHPNSRQPPSRELPHPQHQDASLNHPDLSRLRCFSSPCILVAVCPLLIGACTVVLAAFNGLLDKSQLGHFVTVHGYASRYEVQAPRSLARSTNQDLLEPGAQVPKRTRISVVGDSISLVGSPGMAYPVQLQQMLGEGYLVSSFAHSGRTMLKGGVCWDDPKMPAEACSYWKTEEFKTALASEPDAVIIMLGTNDAKHANWDSKPKDWGEPLCPACPAQGHGGNFEYDYLAMINVFRGLHTKPRILIAIPPPAFEPQLWNFSHDVINEVFPSLIPSIGVKAEVDAVVDVWNAAGGHDPARRGLLYGGNATKLETWTADGIHPRDTALGKIAAAFADAIRGLQLRSRASPLGGGAEQLEGVAFIDRPTALRGMPLSFTGALRDLRQVGHSAVRAVAGG